MVYPTRDVEAFLNNLLTPFYSQKPCCLTVTGSGGKTTTIERLGRYWADQGFSVLVTTSTRMVHPDYHTYPFDHMYIYDEGKPPRVQAQAGKVTLLGVSAGAKFTSVPLALLKQIAPQFDRVLIEGDGGRALPLKIHAPRDPVIYPMTTAVIALVGFGALKKVLDEQVFYLLQRYRQLTADCSPTVTLQVYRRLLEHAEGVFKGCYDLPVVVLCNQLDTLSSLEIHAIPRELTKEWVGRGFSLAGISWKKDKLYYYQEVANTKATKEWM